MFIIFNYFHFIHHTIREAAEMIWLNENEYCLEKLSVFRSVSEQIWLNITTKSSPALAIPPFALTPRKQMFFSLAAQPTLNRSFEYLFLYIFPQKKKLFAIIIIMMVWRKKLIIIIENIYTQGILLRQCITTKCIPLAARGGEIIW